MKSNTMPSNQLGKIVSDYENTDLDSLDLPSERSLVIARECSISISSDLPRAKSSAMALGLDNVNQIDPILRESSLPYLELEFPKLTFFSWAIIFRLAWFCGFSKNGESIKEAKSRAKLGAEKLERLAKENSSVLNVGHGIMNRLVVKELKSRGWQAKECTGEKYWSYTVLENEI
ncbi:MAG: histidine phosphatase family protein [Candidatus Thiodiazotropha sp. (ex Dulcina madagascariensis)]|nr:histidine phosphatase family protein [Candidatus Thiodiazotropha sp. (ex Dulcina madagascariensis)]